MRGGHSAPHHRRGCYRGCYREGFDSAARCHL